jgi:hypothetical protein
MEPEKITQEKLNEKLKNIEDNGIQADRQHLKRNMCTQFADYYEFIREYVVNAYDASATSCLVKVTENQETLTVSIQDNGSGMNLERLKDFLTVFRSRKDNPQIKSVGRHGIGKLSVAAIPGLTSFKVRTSTGSECFDFETNSLIEDCPITIRKNSVVPLQGTTFEITFKKDQTALKLTKKLYDILLTYVRHLPITVRFDVPDENWPGELTVRTLPKGEWTYPPECYGCSYNITLRGKPCEVVVAVGNGGHEVYQNRVYISSKYNLFSYGMKEDIRIPNLLIRVDSEAFELPFGRHCLCNEEVIADLADDIRRRIVPSYFDFLTSHFSFKTLAATPFALEKTDEMAIGLLKYAQMNRTWSNYPVFRLVGGQRLSMTELDKRVAEKHAIYIEAQNGEGIDYNQFNGPVLSLEQANGALKLVEGLYSDAFINLSSEDTVFEMPLNERNKVSAEEKRFESFLAFKPQKLDFDRLMQDDDNMEDFKKPDRKTSKSKIDDYAGICEEARTAERDLTDLEWRVNYLIERDGITPCTRKKFMFRNSVITLNLFHSEIREFVQLSTLNPNLAAHWAMAMCLADSNILPHISADAREDLLILDAMARVESNQATESTDEASKRLDRELMDFMRNCINRPARGNQ